MVIAGLMAHRLLRQSRARPRRSLHASAAAPIFAFGLVAFGFLGMGPVTIAVDCYGPVTDNAQSVFELSPDRERSPASRTRSRSDFGFDADFEQGKHYLEENDGAGNTFKATAKPVLIGTAVVGATTMIFSIILAADQRPDRRASSKLSILHPPFLLGLISGGAVIYWFSGASMQAVTTGAYRAVEFIKKNMNLEGATKAVVEDSKKVVEICTAVRAEGHVEHLHRRVLLDAGLRVLRPELLRRLPDLHRRLRPVPGHLHGQRRRRLGQRQEDRRSRSARRRAPRCTRPPSSATRSAIRSRTPPPWR